MKKCHIVDDLISMCRWLWSFSIYANLIMVSKDNLVGERLLTMAMAML
jgi:hypothetical protein